MSIILIDEVPFKHSLSANDLGNVKAKISAARSTSRKLRLTISAVLQTAPELTPGITAKFLRSECSILAATIYAAMGMREDKRPKLDRCLALPSSFTVKAPIAEPDYVRARPKNSGGFRVTHDFGLKNRTAQRIVALVLGCHFVPCPWQYTFSGIHKAIAEVKQQLNAGHLHFATFDIVDYFGSFDDKKLATELPLPQEWVDNVVVGRHLAVEADKRMGPLPYILSPHELLLLARRGIPLGSGCAPIVAAFCMSKLQWKASSGVGLFDYADNFLLLASGAAGLAKSVGALTDAVANLPGGHFVLKSLQQGLASSGIDFLGHRLSVKNSQVRTTVSLANQESILAKLNELDTKIGAFKDQIKGARYLIRMGRLMLGWLEAFRECDEIEEWESFFRTKLAENAKLLNASLEHFDPGPSCEFSYSSDDYFEHSSDDHEYSYVI